MTTAFLLSNTKILLIDNSLTVSSHFINSERQKPNGYDDNDILIDVPEKFTSTVTDKNIPVFTFYYTFLLGTPLHINDTKTLCLCFNMQSYFDDDAFFVYVMKEAYNLWFMFYRFISILSNERLIYLNSPYEYVPSHYMNEPSFFKEWLEINKSIQIVLNGNEVYYTKVDYYNNQALNKKLENYPFTTKLME